MPHTQSLEISLRLSPLRTVCPFLVRENDCLPVPMAACQELAPAGATNASGLLLPEVIVTVPGDLRRATTKTESSIVS